MAKRLVDEVSLVTGASKGIGRATALALAAEGANVVVTSRTQANLDRLVTEIEALGVQALAVAADASQEDDVRQLQEAAFDAFGRVDILINNVGIAKYAPIEEISITDYDWMMNTNMRSSFLCTKAFLPGMLEREEGVIVFLSSVSGLMGLPGEQVYCATKHAQIGFAQALDHEVHSRGVKVSVIAPGAVRTEHAFGTGRVAGDPVHEAFLDAADVAAAVVFAVTQPPESRIFTIGMRPMREGLFD